MSTKWSAHQFSPKYEYHSLIFQEVSHLANDISDGTNIVYPRTAKLFTKQEASDKFILILEGRAMITIGKVRSLEFSTLKCKIKNIKIFI
jgi:hypothetical protein